jgi:hypothetical protein
MTREITDMSEMTAYDWWLVPLTLTMCVAVVVYVYYGIRLMGYLEVCRHKLWVELGSPQPYKIQWVVKFRFMGWIISGGYLRSGDPHLIRLARIARYSLLAVFVLYAIRLIGGRLLLAMG